MQYAPDFFEDPFGGEGFLMSDTETKRVWVRFNEDGSPRDMCTVENIDPVLERNQQLYNDSIGKRWGDGRIVASIPESIYWRGDFAKARENQDQKWIKRFLNDSDNQKLRTFKGNI